MSFLAPAPSGSPLRRLLQLTWRYRAACLQVFAFQIILLGLVLGGLSLDGLSVVVLRHALDPAAPVPSWPRGLARLADWATDRQLLALGGLVLGMGVLHALLGYAHGIQSGRVQH